MLKKLKFSRPGIIDARARYRAAARLLRNTGLEDKKRTNSEDIEGFSFSRGLSPFVYKRNIFIVQYICNLLLSQ
jgi:hypothetical protein